MNLFHASALAGEQIHKHMHTWTLNAPYRIAIIVHTNKLQDMCLCVPLSRWPEPVVA